MSLSVCAVLQLFRLCINPLELDGEDDLDTSRAIDGVLQNDAEFMPNAFVAAVA